MAEPTIFLSYARADGTDLAAQLRVDLKARGYGSWLDSEQILAGDQFMDKIRAAIRQSKLMIALMTPSSVRNAGDPSNPSKTDSVCLNEIQEARFSANIPIIPVMARKCEAPFAINTLDYVDVTRFPDDGKVWSDGLDRIAKRIESVLAGEAPPRRSRLAALDPLDETFERFLGEVREGFCGRQWIFDEIDTWLKQESPAVLVIAGAPGSGKSAIAAELVYRNNEGQVLAYHVCKADRPPTIDPAAFVRSISDMVASRVDEYRAVLDDPRMQDLLGNADKQPAAAFEFAVLKPLHGIARNHGCYILIDALDEALVFPDKNNIAELLRSSISLLPAWLRVVVTCPPGEAERSMDQPWSSKIEIKGPRNRDDVGAYVDFRLRDPALRTKLADAGRQPADIAQWVRSLDAGNDESNFLYVKLLLNEIEARPKDQLSRNQLPREFDSLYESWLGRFFECIGSEQQPEARRLLGIIVAAAESVTREQIIQTAGPNSSGLLAELLQNLAAYLPENNGRIRAFHKTFTEWLTQESNPYGADVTEGRRSLADLCRREYARIAGIPPHVRIPAGDACGVRLYVLRHGVKHLIEVQDYATAVDLLALLFDHESELERGVALHLGEHAKEISHNLGDCDPDAARAVDAIRLASILRRFYEIEPQYGGIRMLVNYHPEKWEELLAYLLSDDDFVIRFTLATALADCVENRNSPKFAGILKLVKDPDVNRAELGGYALQLVYAQRPRMIDPAVLNMLAASEVYSGRSILGDLLLHLAFTGNDRSKLVTEDRFWNAVWDFNRLDVWDLRATGPFVANSPLPPGIADEVRDAYAAMGEAEAIRQTLLKDNTVADAIRGLLEKYRSLGIREDEIRGAQQEMEKSPDLRTIMRLLLAHPLWNVAEAAASVLSDMPRDLAAPLIEELFSDPYWKVRYGAIEAAFGIRYVDNYELFTKAVHKFYKDANCRVRALCVENLTAQVLACEQEERRRWCDNFAIEIKAWLKDEDCWVLEHVYRLFRQLDQADDDFYVPLLAGGASRLFGNNAEWYRLERADFLRSIEAAKRQPASS